MRKEEDSKNLKRAIERYKPLTFYVRPFSLSNKKEKIKINQKLNEGFHFTLNDGLLFAGSTNILYLPLKDYKYGFKLEYQNKNGARIFPHHFYPNDPEMPKVNRSVLRNVIDDLLIEISFEGKIKLEFDDDIKNFGNLITNYWKISENI